MVRRNKTIEKIGTSTLFCDLAGVFMLEKVTVCEVNEI
jgi:hypothetical protein